MTEVYNPGKGFAFVTFAREEDADDAIEKMDGKMLYGRKLSVKEAKPKRSDVRDSERANEMIEEAFRRAMTTPPSMWGPVNSGNWWLQPEGRPHPY